MSAGLMIALVFASVAAVEAGALSISSQPTVAKEPAEAAERRQRPSELERL